MAGPAEPKQFLVEWLDQAGQRGDPYAPDCPARGVLEHVTSRWGALVLVALLDRSRRYSELGRLLTGVSDKMLSRTLKDLQRDGFVQRIPGHERRPVAVTYDLTALGTGAARSIAALTDWINDNLGAVLDARRSHDLGHREATGSR